MLLDEKLPHFVVGVNSRSHVHSHEFFCRLVPQHVHESRVDHEKVAAHRGAENTVARMFDQRAVVGRSLTLGLDRPAQSGDVLRIAQHVWNAVLLVYHGVAEQPQQLFTALGEHSQQAGRPFFRPQTFEILREEMAHARRQEALEGLACHLGRLVPQCLGRRRVHREQCPVERVRAEVAEAVFEQLAVPRVARVDVEIAPVLLGIRFVRHAPRLVGCVAALDGRLANVIHHVKCATLNY